MEKLTYQEEEAMRFIWNLGPCFVKEIVTCYDEPKPPYTTVASIVYSRYTDFYRLTPEERYRQLIRRSPDLLQLISIKEIPSYLRITPTHMSRIRKMVSFDK